VSEQSRIGRRVAVLRADKNRGFLGKYVWRKCADTAFSLAPNFAAPLDMRCSKGGACGRVEDYAAPNSK